MTAKRRKKWGTDVAQAKPFSIFLDRHGRAAVRIGAQRPSHAAIEIALNAGLAFVRIGPDGGLLVTGEGVVRRHGETNAIVP
jgi:hypothetical protein